MKANLILFSRVRLLLPLIPYYIISPGGLYSPRNGRFKKLFLARIKDGKFGGTLVFTRSHLAKNAALLKNCKVEDNPQKHATPKTIKVKKAPHKSEFLR